MILAHFEAISRVVGLARVYGDEALSAFDLALPGQRTMANCRLRRRDRPRRPPTTRHVLNAVRRQNHTHSADVPLQLTRPALATGAAAAPDRQRPSAWMSRPPHRFEPGSEAVGVGLPLVRLYVPAGTALAGIKALLVHGEVEG
ncbi:hypothetical protein GCM10023235_00600 [Kitasatospora terrestris]|uniref:Uncharacterized protein n=1 Tax=Kitasatospora terrestris TaxID=258051 RepID=A0ABP9D7L7_9ACTN